MSSIITVSDLTSELEQVEGRYKEEVERHSMMFSIITVSDHTLELEQVEGRYKRGK